MRIASTDIPIRIDAPGATARQQTGFGDVTGYTTMGAATSLRLMMTGL